MIDLRAVTLGVPNQFSTSTIGKIKTEIEKKLKPRTFRINLPIQSLDNKHALVGHLDKIQKLCQNLNIRWFNVPFNLLSLKGINIDFLLTLLKRQPQAFINLIVAKDNTIDYGAIVKASRFIKQVSLLGDGGFHNFRLGISCNPCENTPFFPISFSSDSLGFSIALELPRFFNTLFETNKGSSIAQLQEIIISKLVPELVQLDAVCKGIMENSKVTYHGIDISLAPFPENDGSVAKLFEALGLDLFGSNGSLFFTSFLTDALRHSINLSKIKSVGFNGVMFPILEDFYLSDCNNRNMISLDSLISYSSVCGCGLDMVPIPGDTFEEEIASLIIDIAGLSTTLSKPLGVRLLPIPGKNAGQMTEFNMDFLCNSRILKIKNCVAWNERFRNNTFKYKTKTPLLNDQTVKDFWWQKGNSNKDQLSLENLKPLWYVYQEDDKDRLDSKLYMEREQILNNLPLERDMIVLDLGAGNGYWSFHFASKVKYVDAVDYCDNLVQQGIEIAANSKIQNITFHESPAQDFSTNLIYDLIFISGVLIYMNDEDVKKTMSQIQRYTKSGSILFLREGTGILGRHCINNQYSEALGTYYSAIYRSREEYVHSFQNIGFELLKDNNFFPEDSEHNKFQETRLRYYLFQKK